MEKVKEKGQDTSVFPEDWVYGDGKGKDVFVLIDTDGGTDDALAIWMVLKAHQNPRHPIKVVGITCVHGNTKVEHAVKNVSRVLKAVDEQMKIPMFCGASEPIVEPFQHLVEPFHGEDGFGDVDHELEPIKVHVEGEHAVQAIIRLAHEHKGNLTVLALGPLTNLALAVRLDPSTASNLQRIYCMGGNMEGQGNATVSAEFNFAVDPEAAFITLNSFRCPILLFPWETCKKEGKPYSWRVNVLGKIESLQAQLLNKVEHRILEKYTDNWIPCDQLPAAAIIEPNVVRESCSIYCTVELHGAHTRGLMVLDHLGIRKKQDNVLIITRVDSDILEKLMLWAARGP